jgi:undecaprenyl diphosphate synthase
MGAENIGKIVDAAIQERVQVLSLFAFSCENRNRPKSEVVFLMKLFQNTLNSKTIDKLNKRSVQLRWTGLRDKLSSKLLESILLVQAATKHNKKLILNICFNYGGMQDILQAARNAKKCKTIEDFNRLLLTKDLPPVDLLIRTGNEKRISNFLL